MEENNIIKKNIRVGFVVKAKVGETKEKKGEENQEEKERGGKMCPGCGREE